MTNAKMNWMPATLKKYLVSGLLAAAIILCLSAKAPAVERVVILAPAAADIMIRLDAGSSVVGVTNNVTDFPQATRVGTHLNPGVEKIASLRPSLIVGGPRFDPALAERMGVEFFLYDPKSLEAILDRTLALSRKLGKEQEGVALTKELRAMLDGLNLPAHRPTVLFETRSGPLSLAREYSVTKDILERAGMRYAYPKTSETISVEYLIANQPDIYLYQEGPMNKNPIPPHDRQGWSAFRACAWKVDEFAFSRPNTRLFETVRTLNSILNAPDPCAKGLKIYQ